MAPFIVYNGIDSRQLGVVIEKLPDFHRAARRYEQNEVPGRSGVVMTDTGAYETYQTTLEVNTFGVDLHTVYAWLRGEGWLISSDEPDYMAYVYMYPQVDDSRFRASGSAYDTLTVQMIVEPFLRQVTESTVIMSAQGSFPGQGHEPSDPVLTVTGSGDVRVVVNDRAVLIDSLSGDMVIDCGAGVAYQTINGADVFCGTQVTLEDGWPQLQPDGETNSVSWTGSVTQVRIQPCWRWL